MIPKWEDSKYEEAISALSDVKRRNGSGYSDGDLSDLLKIFEYFEDYERCSYLKNIIKGKT